MRPGSKRRCEVSTEKNWVLFLVELCGSERVSHPPPLCKGSFNNISVILILFLFIFLLEPPKSCSLKAIIHLKQHYYVLKHCSFRTILTFNIFILTTTTRTTRQQSSDSDSKVNAS